MAGMMARFKRRIWAGWFVAGLAAAALGSPAALGQGTAAEQEFLFAYRLMQRGDTVEAGEAFDTFLEKFPNDAQRGDALYFRAELYRRGGALAAAAEYLAAATGNAAPQRVPGYAVRLLRGQVLTDLERYDEAIAALESVDLEVLPDRALASVGLLKALAYRGAGNYEASANAASSAAEIASPVRARALLAWARAKALSGDQAGALETLGEALAADDPAVNPEAARYAGDLAFSVGELDRAVAFYSRVIERDQSSQEFPAAVTGRMWADLEAGRNVAVLSAFKQFGEGLPTERQTAARYLAGSAYQQIGQHAPAAELLTQVVAAGREHPVAAAALYKLAVSQFELARYPDMARTVAELERAFPGAPQQIDASFLLASAEAKQGRAAEGVARLAAFIEDGPENPYYFQALLRRAALYEQNDEWAAAADDLAVYLEASADRVGSEEPAAVALRYVELNHRLGRYDVSIATAQDLLSRDQEPAVTQEALYRLGEAQARAGEFRAALGTFDRLQAEHPINATRHAVDLRRGLLLNRLGRTDESMAVLAEAANNPQLAEAPRVAALRIVAAHLRDTERAADAALTLRNMERLGGLEALADHELLWLADYEVGRGEPGEALRTLAVVDGERRRLTGAAESELMLTRGRAYFDRGEFEEAHRAFFGVVALGRGFDLDARLFLARTQAAQGDLDAALVELSDLVNVDDGRVRALALYEAGQVRRARAERLRRRGDAGGAAAALREARASIKRMVVLFLTVEELRPWQERGLIQLAEIAEELNEPQAVARELDELIRAFPDSAYAEYGRAVRDQKVRDRLADALTRLKRMDLEALDPTLRGWVEARITELEGRR
ncbi:MAG: tetratricopeptide repeat protein [Planctomycetota bacterium]